MVFRRKKKAVIKQERLEEERPKTVFVQEEKKEPKKQIRRKPRLTADHLIKAKPGEQCEYFGDTLEEFCYTIVCKTDDMEDALKIVCGKRDHEVLRIKELVNNESAVRVKF